MEQDITFTHDPLGNSGDGFYQTITPGSFQHVLNIVCKRVHNDNRWKDMTKIFCELGLGLPSLILSHYIFELSFHVEIELNEELHNISNMNVKDLTEKVIKNLRQGYFGDNVVKREGELHRVCPPNAAIVSGNIVSKFAEYEHLFILSHNRNQKRYITSFMDQKDIDRFGSFIYFYGFDAVSGPFIQGNLTKI